MVLPVGIEILAGFLLSAEMAFDLEVNEVGVEVSTSFASVTETQEPTTSTHEAKIDLQTITAPHAERGVVDIPALRIVRLEVDGASSWCAHLLKIWHTHIWSN